MNEKHFVIDTNVFVSAMLFPQSIPKLAVDKALASGRLVLSRAVIQELADKFSSKKFDRHVSLADRLLYLETVISLGLYVEPKEFVKVCRDPNDDMFLDLALASSANCIISGDRAVLELHPFRGIPIISAAEFVRTF
ncbi:MAG: putative toxin-antitoxin system toxin component, PIN family [Cytophagales bacterium]|jgi:putative PIN family toxin of toxin-antitoxin system|nr:putative toxin-antitoxin system toxin component, PIN family [Cytophagales bacterium]MCA6369285.1 putative toxin-antitoxin system toxin component, PIN family [Cytophagales bacterium]MCA6371836.1 putative toxin-antitoxin system toxin component, PIN family [Cytophagales bacterium]MCA6376051.1 putative toxin-antitoxin system toxin component, PIN family [Cytophagales bacterium]MCA6384230.1 putative toxin-antitoxin system toxin component, PIN family [Cytophagales bacterium]